MTAVAYPAAAGGGGADKGETSGSQKSPTVCSVALVGTAASPHGALRWLWLPFLCDAQDFLVQDASMAELIRETTIVLSGSTCATGMFSRKSSTGTIGLQKGNF